MKWFWFLGSRDGTEHRSQVATILTQLGVEPPEMDGWTYFFEADKLVPI